ncbi:MAG TPA: hypothetical protein VF329_15150 [Gammaproteobacteria bacterium]
MLERHAAAGTPRGARPAPVPSAETAIAEFWAHHERYRVPLRRSIARLAELALSDDCDVAAYGTRLLFERIVEPLCDGFTGRGAETYRSAFAQIIAAARVRPQCASLDRALAEDGVMTTRELLGVPQPAPLGSVERSRVRTILVPSRLTLGADVAITMPILGRMETLFPQARIVLLGTRASAVLARSFARVAHAEVPYRRSDFLSERLNAWPALRAAARVACKGLRSGEYLLVDPDSRLTQLGLLRPVPPERYFHFPSRSYGEEGTEPLGVLVRRWLDETFGGCGTPDHALRIDSAVAARWRALRARWADGALAVSASFGVGGNGRKRAGLELEADLLERLVHRGARVLLARGATPGEASETRRLAGCLAARGIATADLDPQLEAEGLLAASVLTWEGDVDTFFAAVACADVYVGYDSAGQHIAAALDVPALDLFIESAGPRHAMRWTPRGRAPLRVVRSPSPPDAAVLLEHATRAFDALVREANR